MARFSVAPEPWLKPHVDIAVDLLETAAQLLDPVHRVLDPPGQLAHLGFDPIHAQFGIDRAAGLRYFNRSQK